jgi:hypothetical protein
VPLTHKFAKRICIDFQRTHLIHSIGPNTNVLGVSDRFFTARDVNPLGFVPDEAWDNSIDGGDDVHGPTTTFQERCILATYTPPLMVPTIL